MEFQKKLDSLLKLVSGRTSGTASDDQIEEAISSLLAAPPSSSIAQRQRRDDCVSTICSATANDPLLKPPSSASLRSAAMDSSHGNGGGGVGGVDKGVSVSIVPDEEEYDELESDSRTTTDSGIDNGGGGTRSNQQKQKQTSEEPAWTGEKATIESLRKQDEDETLRKRRRDEDGDSPGTATGTARPLEAKPTVWNHLDEIPLGRTGGRMMVTFGDGPHPRPDACAAALLATRQCVQNAVKDARALRRQMKDEYQHARTTAHLHKANPAERASLARSAGKGVVLDPDLLYRAIGGGMDSMAFDIKVGFDEQQLKKLFPEEMTAYRRWNQMHKSFKKKDDNEQTNKDKNTDTTDSSDSESSAAPSPKWGGHLQTRLQQFDVRTQTMRQRWYMAFAEVRRGSFLSKTPSSIENSRWKAKRKLAGKDKSGGGRGKIKVGTWESLPASHVQFLHWVGFDPRSSLPPPCVNTAEALAFLGYDFMGKIVEKAIFLRCTKKFDTKNGKPGTDDQKLVLQLDASEQLTKEDIDVAMKDSTLMAKPLYNACNSVLDGGEAAQLYFGPGFEERIEMEMDQLVMGQKKGANLSNEEKRVRVEEEEMFDELKKPPVVLEGVLDLLGDEHRTDELVKLRTQEKKKRRRNDEEGWVNLERATKNLDPLVKTPKKRGRPPKVLIPLKK